MSQDAPPPPPPEPPSAHQKVPLGSIVLIVAGALICLISAAVFVGGGALVWAYGTQRDSQGFFTTSTERFETTSSAITSERIDLGTHPGSVGSFWDLGGGITVRLRAQSTTGNAVFVGIARQQDVDRYLAGIAHAELQSVHIDPFSASYDYVGGLGRAAPPATTSIWVASAQGVGAQSLQWKLRSGSWAVVVMNASGAPGVGVDASVAATAPWVLGLGIGLLAGGGVVLIIGVAMLVIGVVALARGTEIDLTSRATRPGQPIRLEGRLDEPLNRWLWLVKWLLLIPHFIVLAVLWIAFFVVTIAAFFAILFTGRYPRSLFEFNTGVLRWTWRVTFYGYSALGTDAYPPFTLGDRPDYPATLTIEYPERLSRGLVLIKWWLLAIPQYLVLAILGGGLALGSARWAAVGVPFGGLIGLLVFIAAIALLFTGRYPRGVFDFVMGLDRWIYRVVPYVALMRDEYPPFRLDQGPEEAPPPERTPPTPTGSGAAAPPPDRVTV
jgi:Domain of unknown function (DUF4389)